MDVYDQLAAAAQAVMAEKEASEEARADKIRQALVRAGHTDEMHRLGAILAGQQHQKGR